MTWFMLEDPNDCCMENRPRQGVGGTGAEVRSIVMVWVKGMEAHVTHETQWHKVPDMMPQESHSHPMAPPQESITSIQHEHVSENLRLRKFYGITDKNSLSMSRSWETGKAWGAMTAGCDVGSWRTAWDGKGHQRENQQVLLSSWQSWAGVGFLVSTSVIWSCKMLG